MKVIVNFWANFVNWLRLVCQVATEAPAKTEQFWKGWSHHTITIVWPEKKGSSLVLKVKYAVLSPYILLHLPTLKLMAWIWRHRTVIILRKARNSVHKINSCTGSSCQCQQENLKNWNRPLGRSNTSFPKVQDNMRWRQEWKRTPTFRKGKGLRSLKRANLWQGSFTKVKSHNFQDGRPELTLYVFSRQHS